MKSKALVSLGIAAFVTFTACGSPSRTGSTGGDVSGPIAVDGSSTVFPISEAIAEEWSIANSQSQVQVSQSGTGGGFKKFCNNETDINDASRPIKDEEKQLCTANGVEFVELEIAIDGLSVVVNTKNDFAKCLTIDELKKAWVPDSSVKTWRDIRAAFPAKAIKFYAPGADSGTFDYFTEVVVGEAKAMRQEELQTSEDDNILVTGIKGDQGSLGFFGYAYYKENAKAVRAIGVDSGKGCVEPTDKTIANGSYEPLSRPLFIYVSKTALKDKPQIRPFVEYYLDTLTSIIGDVGYIAIPEERANAARAALDATNG